MAQFSIFSAEFVGSLDKLFDEDILLGRGWTTHESLRPLAYSTVADFVHHVPQRPNIHILAKEMHLLSKNLHDKSLPTSIQVSDVTKVTQPRHLRYFFSSVGNVMQVTFEFSGLHSTEKRC